MSLLLLTVNRFIRLLSSWQTSFFTWALKLLVVVNSPKDSKQSAWNGQVPYKNQKALPPDEPIFTNSTRWTAKKVRKLHSWIYWKNSVTYICKISKKSLHFPWTWLTCPPVLTRKGQHCSIRGALVKLKCSASHILLQLEYTAHPGAPRNSVSPATPWNFWQTMYVNSNFLQLLLLGCHSKRQIQ